MIWLVAVTLLRKKGVGGVRRHLMGFCASVTAAVFLILLLGEPPKQQTDPVVALAQCQRFVEDRLKAPAAAEFPAGGYQLISRDVNAFTLRSYVDAPNAFGVKVRTDFLCEVEWNGAEHLSRTNWKLNRLEFHERT
ncbi:MAG: hypothetical protein ACXU8N_10905 [Telluria sp.]